MFRDSSEPCHSAYNSTYGNRFLILPSIIHHTRRPFSFTDNEECYYQIVAFLQPLSNVFPKSERKIDETYSSGLHNHNLANIDTTNPGAHTWPNCNTTIIKQPHCCS